MQSMKKPIVTATLALLLFVSVVFGATTLLYYWYMNLTASTPKVRFIYHSNGTMYNTLTLSYNLYADIWTYDSNASYGIRNTDSSPHTVYIYINTISNTSAVYNVTVDVRTMDGDTLMAETTWEGGSLPTASQSFSASATTTYMLRVWVKGQSTVSNVNVGMNLEVAE